MPLYPQISGALNNCAINVALPTMLDRIGDLAQQEQEDGAIERNTVTTEYFLIKSLFSKFYSLKQDLSWTEFYEILESQEFYVQQMIMGPVMRDYIAEKGMESQEYGDGSGLKADIRGRYPGLDAREADKLLYAPLGISATFHELQVDDRAVVLPFNDSKDEYTEVYSSPISNLNESHIDVYFHDEHFELQPHDQIPRQDPAVKRFPDNFEVVNDSLTDGISLDAGLKALKSYVKTINPPKQDFSKRNYHTFTPEEKSVLAVNLSAVPTSSLENKNKYKSTLQALIKNKEFFFTSVPDKIDLNTEDLNKVEGKKVVDDGRSPEEKIAEQIENDEEFAIRLQEAELRNAGFKPK